MPSKSKIKGATWEREISSILEKFLEGKFIRTPGSGAYVGGINSFRQQILGEGTVKVMRGDIVPPEHLSKLIIEAKNYNDISFHKFWTDCKQLNSWLDQLYSSLCEDGIHFLIFKITHKGSWIVFDKSYGFINTSNYFSYNYNNKEFIVCDFQKFIELNADLIKQKAK